MSEPLPTKDQRTTLISFNLWVPEKRSLAEKMLVFVMQGNGAPDMPNSPVGRAELLLKSQKEWAGKRVISDTYGKGIVRYVLPENVGYVKFLRKVKAQEIHPFKAVVEWQDGVKCVRLGHIKRDYGTT